MTNIVTSRWLWEQDCAFGNLMTKDAGSVDGEWNSGRMLPELTRYGGAELTSSKYFGKPGLDALRAMLMHADHYGLKWIFVRDRYYDPLLAFAGWRPVDSLDDQTITVWSKDGVPPAMPVVPAANTAALAGSSVGNSPIPGAAS